LRHIHYANTQTLHKRCVHVCIFQKVNALIELYLTSNSTLKLGSN